MNGHSKIISVNALRWLSTLGWLGLAAAALATEGSSTAEKPVASAQTAASIGVTLDFFPMVPDIARRRDPTDQSGNVIKAKNYAVLDSQFHLDFQLNRDVDFSSALRASLGFRNAFDRMDTEYASTEFSGYTVAFRQNLGSSLLLDLRFSDRHSEGLRLVSNHYAIESSLSLLIQDQTGEAKTSDVLSFRLTPNVAMAKTYGRDEKDIYDPRWGVDSEIRYMSRDGAGFPIAFAVESFFQRSLGDRLDGVDHGGAGLLTIIPKVESLLSKQLWVGAYVNVPTLRPSGREESFNDPSLPGLYGHSAGFYIKSLSF